MRDQRRPRAHARRGSSGFAAGMAAANYDDIKRIGHDRGTSRGLLEDDGIPRNPGEAKGDLPKKPSRPSAGACGHCFT
jgi:hypothetical protein